MLDEDPSPEEEQSTLGLLQRMRAGDRAAGDELFGQHRGRLLRALKVRLGRPSAACDYEELVQETFGKALLDLDRFQWRGQGAFLAWMLQIALHTARDLARRESLAPRALSADSRSGGFGAAGRESGTPSAELARSEERALLDSALEQLDEGERDAVVRRKILGQDYRSLAEDLGLTEGAVRMRVSRAMVELTRLAHRHA